MKSSFLLPVTNELNMHFIWYRLCTTTKKLQVNITTGPNFLIHKNKTPYIWVGLPVEF